MLTTTACAPEQARLQVQRYFGVYPSSDSLPAPQLPALSGSSSNAADASDASYTSDRDERTLPQDSTIIFVGIARKTLVCSLPPPSLQPLPLRS